jgi:hypothetical protein
MTSFLLPSQFRNAISLLGGLIAAALLSSCAVGPAGLVDGGLISKVKTTKVEAKGIRAKDRAIPFEKEYHLHGALTAAEQRARFGDYFTAFWKVEDRSLPVTVSFDYRQQNSKDTVHNKSVQVQPSRSNVTHFDVIGQEVEARGAVSAWRISLIQGGKTVATYNSFLWE